MNTNNGDEELRPRFMPLREATKKVKGDVPESVADDFEQYCKFVAEAAGMKPEEVAGDVMAAALRDFLKADKSFPKWKEKQLEKVSSSSQAFRATKWRRRCRASARARRKRLPARRNARPVRPRLRLPAAARRRRVAAEPPRGAGLRTRGRRRTRRPRPRPRRERRRHRPRRLKAVRPPGLSALAVCRGARPARSSAAAGARAASRSRPRRRSRRARSTRPEPRIGLWLSPPR